MFQTVINEQGIARSPIESYEDFLSYDLPNYLDSVQINAPTFSIKFKYSTPSENIVLFEGMIPKKARVENGYYEALLEVDMIRTDFATQKVETQRVPFCNIPIMVGSFLDKMRSMSTEERLLAGEPATDYGGYFIMEGAEKLLLMQEKSKQRFPGLYYRKSKNKEDPSLYVTYTSGDVLTDIQNKVFQLFYEENLGFIASIEKEEDPFPVMFLFYVIITKIMELTGKISYDNFIGLHKGYFTRIIKMGIRQLVHPNQDTQRRLRFAYNLIDESFNNFRFSKFFVQLNPDDVINDKAGEIRRLQRPINDEIRRMFKYAANFPTEHMQDDFLNKIFRNTLYPRDVASFIPLKEEQNGQQVPVAKYAISHVLESKFQMLCYFCLKLSDYYCNYRALDDMDDWSFKYVTTAGAHMRQQFNTSFSKLSIEISNDINHNHNHDFATIVEKVRKSTKITDSFRSSFKSGNWGTIIQAQSNITIVDNIDRGNILAHLSNLSRIRTPGSSHAGNEKRYIQPSQYGYGCPITTPERETVGLIKDHTILAKLTTTKHVGRVVGLTLSKLHRPLEKLFDTNVSLTPVFFDGIIVGLTSDPYAFRENLRGLRRSGRIDRYTGIIYTNTNELFVYSDAGRFTRPLLVVNKETGKHVFEEKGLQEASLETLVSEGAIEYIDSLEQKYTFILDNPTRLAPFMEAFQAAKTFVDKYLNEDEIYPYVDLYTLPGVPDPLDRKDPIRSFLEFDIADAKEDVLEEYREIKRLLADSEIVNSVFPDYTEISSQAILGVSPACIPYLDRTQGPRLTYQAAMGKQALGADITNNSPEAGRMSAYPIYEMVKQDVPITYTDVGKWIGLDVKPIGVNVISAMMCWKGFNQEDAIVVNKKAIDRGLFELIFYYGYEDGDKHSTGGASEFYGMPPNEINKTKYSHIWTTDETKDQNLIGLPKIGSHLKTGDIAIAKYIVKGGPHGSPGATYIDVSVYVGYSESGNVDIAERIVSSARRISRVRLRNVKKPEVGDKLSSRYSQKGIIGAIVPDEEMPSIHAPGTALHGIKPSILFNPHGIPSRMTIGKLYEFSSSLLALLDGKRVNASPFRPFDEYSIQRQLVAHGLPSDGAFHMRNSETGELFPTKINVGVVYYQILRHFVHKKVRARGKGLMDPRTRQPQKGTKVQKGNIYYGPIRAGHMEMSALKASGVAYVVQERTMYSSDVMKVLLCHVCGSRVRYLDKDKVQCAVCNSSDIVDVELPASLIYINDLLSGWNMEMKLKTKKVNVL